MSLIIVSTTGACNLRCLYCGGSFPPKYVPWELRYDIDYLIKFLRETGSDVAFYGGEPLLNPQVIVKVMDELDDGRRFIIQTNGTLPESLPPEYWLKFDAVLLSIDGRREVNDYYRGQGNYERVLKTAYMLRDIGYSGDLIARMTLWDKSDVYEDVTHLLNLKVFDHVHWQLNVIWTEPWDFSAWANTSYIPGLRRLADMWVSNMSSGEVLGIVPFLGVMKVALFGEWRSPPCGSGTETFTVLPDGRIVACPIAVENEWAVVGHITRGSIRRVEIGKPCTSCPYFKYCGGRCLYAYKERLWGEKGFLEVCRVTKEMIDILLSKISHIKRLIREGVISASDFYYPPFDNTTEIIP